jgi:hypothetical protein
LEIVDDLNWKFSFGKHKGHSIKEVIESNPSTSSSGIIDVYGKRQFVGSNLALAHSLISYLEWAEKENILSVSPIVWKEIKVYDHLYTKIKSHENRSICLRPEIYNESVKKFNKLKGIQESDSNQKIKNIKFWKIDMDNPVVICARICRDNNSSAIYLEPVDTDYKGCTIYLGDFYEEVQELGDESFDCLITIKVYIRELKPNLKKQDIDRMEALLKLRNETEGITQIDNSLAIVRGAFKKLNSNDDVLKKQSRNLILAEIID